MDPICVRSHSQMISRSSSHRSPVGVSTPASSTLWRAKIWQRSHHLRCCPPGTLGTRALHLQGRLGRTLAATICAMAVRSAIGAREARVILLTTMAIVVQVAVPLQPRAGRRAGLRSSYSTGPRTRRCRGSKVVTLPCACALVVLEWSRHTMPTSRTRTPSWRTP